MLSSRASLHPTGPTGYGRFRFFQPPFSMASSVAMLGAGVAAPGYLAGHVSDGVFVGENSFSLPGIPHRNIKSPVMSQIPSTNTPLQLFSELFIFTGYHGL